MNIGFKLSRILKELRTTTADDRLTRAMYLANAIGYYVRITPDCPASECAEQNMAFFRKVIGQVNENIAVDTKKAIELFKCVIDIRHKLMMGVIDPAIIQMAMFSLTSDDVYVSREAAVSKWLASHSEFCKAQLELGDLLNQASSDETE